MDGRAQTHLRSNTNTKRGWVCAAAADDADAEEEEEPLNSPYVTFSSFNGSSEGKIEPKSVEAILMMWFTCLTLSATS